MTKQKPLVLTPATMSKDERSVLVYAESCAVDAGGLLEGIRMNEDDHMALVKLASLNYLRYGRIPAKLLRLGPKQSWTNWVKLTETGWALAHACRRFRAKPGPYATEVFQEMEAREALAVGKETGNG